MTDNFRWPGSNLGGRKHKIINGPNNHRPHPKDEGKYCFHRCLSVNILGGGYPHPADQRMGYPYPSWLGGWYAHPSHPVLMGGGVPHPAMRGGGTYPRSGWGVPPSQIRMGIYPQLEQHSVYLPRGGWCASCIHAGGLSCFYIFLN